MSDIKKAASGLFSSLRRATAAPALLSSRRSRAIVSSLLRPFTEFQFSLLFFYFPNTVHS